MCIRDRERGLRPGTENLPYALGLAAAATRLAGSIKSRDKAVRALNDRLRAGPVSYTHLDVYKRQPYTQYRSRRPAHGG